MIVADTDVLIDYLADSAPGAAWVADALEAGNLVTTVITRFELLTGARQDGDRIVVEDLLEALPSLPLDDAAANRAAHIGRQLLDVGLPIGMGDCLIAGIVVTAGG